MSSTKEVNQYYTYALIRCHVLNPPRTLRNPKLKQDARDLLVNQGWGAFAAAYGWEYVEGFIDGGTYYALLEVHTSSEAEQRDVAGKLSGYYGPFSASAKFESALKDIQKSLAINVSVTLEPMDYRIWLRHNVGVQGYVRSFKYETYSDERYKTDVGELSNALERLKVIRAHRYHWRAGSDRDAGRAASSPPQIGVIAQELQGVFPELVSAQNGDFPLTMDYSGLTAVLVEATKELGTQLDEHEQTIVDLQNKLRKIEESQVGRGRAT